MMTDEAARQRANKVVADLVRDLSPDDALAVFRALGDEAMADRMRYMASLFRERVAYERAGGFEGARGVEAVDARLRELGYEVPKERKRRRAAA